MSFLIRVQGGTGAGRKRALREARKAWVCPTCFHEVRYAESQPGYRPMCPHGHKRPDAAR